MVFCRTEEGVSAVGGSVVLVMSVTLDGECEERYVFCTDLQSCLYLSYLYYREVIIYNEFTLV
jgi:hypothetical protein